MTVAGHSFDAENKCLCGITRQQIKGASRRAIGNPGWCHIGLLTEREWLEIHQDQPPAILGGVITTAAGTMRLYHDCDFSAEIVTRVDHTIQIKRDKWWLVACPKCGAEGRVSEPYPMTAT